MVISSSVVVHEPDHKVLSKTLRSLNVALRYLDAAVSTVYLVDNTPVDKHQPLLPELADTHGARLLAGHGNVGFGRGHNLVLDEVGDYHLILNPDIELAPDALRNALAFMEALPDCGLLTPSASWPGGTRQYLCKRYPSVLDLLLRGFAPTALRQLFAARLDRYEMRDVIDGERVYWDPLIVSGCFMFFRGSVLRALGGFDPRYFLYFEDFDLSLRAAQVARIAYVPSVRVEHHGGNTARKGWTHVRMFVRSALIFFRTHGWKWW